MDWRAVFHTVNKKTTDIYWKYMHNFRYFPSTNSRIDVSEDTKQTLTVTYMCASTMIAFLFKDFCLVGLVYGSTTNNIGQYKQFKYNNVSLCHLAHTQIHTRKKMYAHFKLKDFSFDSPCAITVTIQMLFIRIELNDLFVKFFLVSCVCVYSCLCFFQRFLHNVRPSDVRLTVDLLLVYQTFGIYFIVNLKCQINIREIWSLECRLEFTFISMQNNLSCIANIY